MNILKIILIIVLILILINYLKKVEKILYKSNINLIR